MDNQFDDDFQFKPLTEGLGFHKKTLELKDEVLKSMPTQTGILPQSKKITQPLTSIIKPAHGKANFLETVANTSKVLTVDRQTQKVTDQETTKPVFASYLWSAAVFDTAIVGGLCLLFSAMVFALTKVEVSTT